MYSVPSHTLKILIELENTIKRKQVNHLVLYAIINCGFFDGKHCDVAFRIMESWCEHSGVKFGGGIGQGAGEMLGRTKNIPFNRGPFRNLEKALQKLIKRMESVEAFEVTYLSPYFPQFLFRFLATLHWNGLARKNGLRKIDIFRRC